MTIQSSIRGLALCVAAAFGLSINTPSQAQVEVDVDITLGGLTILYYYNQLDVTIPAAAFAGLIDSCTPITNGQGCSEGAASALTATADGVGFTADAAIAPDTGALNLSAVPLDLDNVWAVRAVGGSSANTELTFAVGAGATLVNAGGGNIQVNSALGYVAAAPAATVSFSDPGLVTPTNGGVRLVLNLTNATSSGEYSGASNATYTISISGT